MTQKPVIPATEDHPAIYRDGHRLTATPPRVPTPDGERAESMVYTVKQIKRLFDLADATSLTRHEVQKLCHSHEDLRAERDEAWAEIAATKLALPITPADKPADHRLSTRAAYVVEQLRSDLATARAAGERAGWIAARRAFWIPGIGHDAGCSANEPCEACTSSAASRFPYPRAASPEPIRPAGPPTDERESDYRAGYSTGYSDAIAGREMRDEGAAALWLWRAKA
jgi:hypothetical protein